MRDRRLQLFAGIAVSAVALAWFLRGVDWPALVAELARVRLGWVALSAVVLLGEFAIRALRWKVLLRPVGPARVRDLFAAWVIGAAANTLLPLRAGEVAKPLVAARRTGHPVASVVATSVMERVYDLLGMITVMVLMAVVLPAGVRGTVTVPPDQVELIRNLKLYGGLFGGAALAAMGVFFFLASREHAARNAFLALTRAAPGPLRRFLVGLFDGFVAGLGNARDRRGLVEAGLLSVWMWVNGAVAIWFLFRAFSMDLPFGAACFVGVAIALTVAIPQAPGFLGVFHVAMEKTMILWGQEPAGAQGFAIVFWAVSFLPVTAVGLAAAWREGLSLAAMRSLRAGEEAG